MFKSYRFRLQPNKEQAELLNKWEGHTRWLWNHFLDLNQKEYAANKKFIWRYDLDSIIPELKKQNEWLKEAPSQSLQQISLSLDTALKGLKSGKGFPKFKKKNVRNGQILIKNSPVQITPSKTHIKLPKIGAVKWIQHRDLPNGRIKQAQITRDVDKWFVSVLVELPGVLNQDGATGPVNISVTEQSLRLYHYQLTNPRMLTISRRYMQIADTYLLTHNPLLS